MNLLKCTTDILQVAEQVSGRPVRVLEDAKLSVLATIRMARGNAPMHVLAYRPVVGRQPDYQICYQCGFVIRLFENPPDRRFDFGGAPLASEKMENILSDRSFPPEIRSAKDMLINGLLTQLRSVPIGLRIDDWLWSLCPDVRAEQIASSKLQLRQNAEALSPNIRKSFPKVIVKANTSINAAFALFWAAKLEDASISLPYRSIGADIDGKALLDIFKTVDSKPTSDCALVDQWADELGLRGWYNWIPYKLEE
jgi:hypothetical protein